MNAAENTEEAPDTPVIQGPGKQLRDVRVAKEMDINRVASLLHLNVSMLEALEADDFSKLPSAVFVQGYLRNYARLLDVPVGPILDAFHLHRPAEEENANLQPAEIKREVRSSHTLIRLITWLIVIVSIGLVVTWWYGYLQWPLGGRAESDSQAIAQPVDPSPAELDRPLVAEDGSVTLPALLDKPEILDAPVPGTDESTGTTSGESSGSGALDSGQMAAEPAGTGAGGAEDTPLAESATVSESPATTAEPDPVVTSAAVSVSFSDACWTDIKDASGSYRVIGNKVAGDRLVLAGEAPYQMVFGNAAAVTVTVDGEPYDLAPHIRGNVAKLTLRIE